MVESFSSTTIKRVCRATLRAETHALQNESGQEAGDRIRAVLAETYGFGSQGTEWETLARRKVLHVSLTDCRNLADHLNSDAPARVQDKRLQIELSQLSALRPSSQKMAIALVRFTPVVWTGSTRLRKPLTV